MHIIDRYLLRQFVQVLAICFCSLTGLYVVIDAFGNLDDFIAQTESGVELMTMMSEFYAYRSLAFFDRISGLLALIAAMFTVTWIERHNELVALMSAGISRLRVITPVLVAAMAISLLAAASRELVMPNLRAVLARDTSDLSGETPRDLEPRYDAATRILLGGEATLAKTSEISKPWFRLPPPLRKLGKNLAAQSAVYVPSQGDRPGGYLLRGVTQPDNVDELPSLSIGERPVILTPLDHDWLKPGECFVASDVTFEMLQGGTAWREYSSTPELVRGLANASVDFGADVRVAVHARIVQPLLDCTLLLVGLPLILTRRNRNLFLAVALCLAVVVGFMQVVLVCHYLGTHSWIRPALAVWLPLLIFVPAAAGLSGSIWKS